MVSSITGSQASNILAGFSNRPTTASGSTASFTEQLAAALEGYLGNSGNSPHLQIDIQTTQSQNSGVRQFIVTVKDPASAPGQTPAAASPAASAPALSIADAASDPLPSVHANSVQASSVQTGASESTPMDEATRANLTRAEIDAYWAAQPPEVQQLRNVADFGERSRMAQQLADQGFTIDRAIMVWGWDPLKTMATRKMYGYTWVPNMNQATVSAAPGFALPGQKPYDAGAPPAGSIAVNTDFANGLGITDPWA
ncbi:MAG: hypothetical protein JWO19_1803 [Bryobacterales bacterium]|nr:hypothetical protein [Bryobacterales bacterium]